MIIIIPSSKDERETYSSHERELKELRATRAQKLQTKRLLVYAIDAPTALNTPLYAKRTSTTLLLPFTIFRWTVIDNPPVLTFPTHLNIQRPDNIVAGGECVSSMVITRLLDSLFHIVAYVQQIKQLIIVIFSNSIEATSL